MLVKTRKQFDTFINNLLAEPDYIVFDTETFTVRPYNYNGCMIGLAIYLPTIGEDYYLPFRHGMKPDAEDPEIIVEGTNLPVEWIKEIPTHTPQTWIGFNAKFDLHVLHTEGLRLPDSVWDVMLAAQILNEEEDAFHGQRKGAYELKRLSREYLGPDSTPGEEELFEFLGELGYKTKGDMWRLSAEQTHQYATDDVKLTWRLLQFYIPYLHKWHQWDLFLEYSEFYRKVLFRMEKNGVRIDQEALDRLYDEAEVEALRIHRLINEVAKEAGLWENVAETWTEYRMQKYYYGGTEEEQLKAHFNPGSPNQLRALLKKIGTPVKDTSADTLERLAQVGNELASLILDWRVQSKARNTFLGPWRDACDPRGYIHPTYLILTTTGRTICMDPNFLQVPRKGRYSVKQVVIPEDGFTMFQGDYKSQELYYAIFLAGESQMAQLVENGEDLHAYTTNAINIRDLLYEGMNDREILRMVGVPNAQVEEMTDEEAANAVATALRYLGKTANFGLLYGMGADRGAQYFNISKEGAKALIEAWHAQYPSFRKAYKEYQTLAKTWRDPDGNPARPGEGGYQYIRLEDGRVRHYHLANMAGQVPAYHTAFNFAVQGAGAVITRRATMRVCEAFPDDDLFRPKLTVYDSLIGDVNLYWMDEVIGTIKEIMEEYDSVPRMKVEPEVGPNWLELKEWKPGAKA